MNVTHGAVILLLLAVMLAGAPAANAGWHNSLRPTGPRGAAITLAEEHRTDYVIVIPAKPTTQEEKASEDLALWLGQMTGAAFRIVPDTAPPIETEISVGRTNRLAKADLPQADAHLGDEGYAIGAQGQRLFLCGGRTRGPIYAVYALLEEDLGCRWYAGEGSDMPYRPTLRFRPVLRHYVPPLLIRDPFYSDAFNATWSLRNRTNAPGAAVPEEWGGHVDYDGMFVHTFNQLVPPSEYFDDHPEYFSLLDGVRTPRQLCLTNSEVIRIATDRVLDVLEANPHTEIIEVSPNDGGAHCLCPACSALDAKNGSPSGSLITFVNHIAEAVEKDHPRVWISTLAYLDTVDAPQKVRPRENVIVRLCNDLHSWRYPLCDFAAAPYPESERYRRAIIGWSKIADHLSIWDYTVNFSHYLAPMPNMHVIAPSVWFYIDHNVKGIMFQGAYQSPGAERMEMRCWVMAKLLWDPSRDVERLTQDFIWGYYGKAAPAIAEYYELLEQAGRERGQIINEKAIGIRYPMDSEFLSREFLDQATVLFDRAEAAARSDEVRRRVQLARLPITYVKLSRGPEFTGVEEYRALLDEFESIARREKITHLAEGPPDLDVRLQQWRDALRVHGELSKLQAGAAEIWALPAEWRFAIDADDVGVSQAWFAAALDDSAWAAVRSDQGNGWESQGFPHYTGVGWYRQAVAIPDKLKRKHLYLHFRAVDEEAWVYINGRPAFEHTCASTGLAPQQIWVAPFAFDAGEHLQPGEANTIAVRVRNIAGMGGIYKRVYVVAADRPLDTALIEALLEAQSEEPAD